ncbi:hypothetical protein FLGE108171_00830 [Flavobacterium gelidilacus]|uniref:hypothetical protein n=1 Tax=Flavobacterium gelidilacus TaxID=206041 RepID=UPI0004258CBE|nr:hypothetical protein [Flavobacterium gelidilacus]
MKYEIPFDAEIYKEQMTLNFNITWLKNVKKNQKNFYWGIAYIILGLFIIYLKNNLGYLFIAIAIHVLINCNTYYNHYKKNKKRYFDEVTTDIEKQANKVSKWELNEDHLFFKQYNYETTINWEVFKSYSVINKNLFVNLSKDRGLSYVLGEKEVGTNEFKKIIDFIDTKIKNVKIVEL